MGVDANANGVIDYYNADVVTANDYYPGGMSLPGRKYQAGSNSYRYGFNGKEKDNGRGEGNLDFGARILDTRLGGRWLSTDPLQKKYPGESPYLFTGGNPILFQDIDGRDRIVTITVKQNGRTVFAIKRTFYDEYKYEYHNSETVLNVYKRDIIVNITVNLPETKVAYQEAMKNPQNVVSEKGSPGALQISSFPERANAIAESANRYFDSKIGNESNQKIKDAFNLYAAGTDGEWKNGLPAAGEGSQSINLAPLLTLAGMAKGVEKPIDLVEQINYDVLSVTIKIIDQQTKNFENIMTSIEQTKNSTQSSKPKTVDVYNHGASKDNHTDSPNGTFQHGNDVPKADTNYYNQPKTSKPPKKQ